MAESSDFPEFTVELKYAVDALNGDLASGVEIERTLLSREPNAHRPKHREEQNHRNAWIRKPKSGGEPSPDSSNQRSAKEGYANTHKNLP